MNSHNHQPAHIRPAFDSTVPSRNILLPTTYRLARVVATSRLLLWIGCVIVVFCAGCMSQSSAASQSTQGQALYQQHCARCHGSQGEGKRGPTLIGPTNSIGGYGNAQGLYDYVSRVMPFDAPGSLSEDEYWAVIAYMFDANHILPPDTTIDQSNAAGIAIQ